jgi:hypothetical protein
MDVVKGVAIDGKEGFAGGHDGILLEALRNSDSQIGRPGL